MDGSVDSGAPQVGGAPQTNVTNGPSPLRDGSVVKLPSPPAPSDAGMPAALDAGPPPPTSTLPEPPPYVCEQNVDAPWSDFALTLQQTQADPQPGDEFGRSLALNADTLLVGSAHAHADVDDPPDLPPQGYVYSYEKNAGLWEPGRAFPVAAGGPRETDNISGESVGLGTDVGFFSDVFVDDGVNYSRGWYLLERAADGWAGAAKPRIDRVGLLDEPVTPYPYVSPQDDVLLGVVGGGEFLTEEAVPQDRVHVLELQGGEWHDAHTLTAPDGHFQNGFGRYLARSGNTILVGAPGDNEQGASAGAAYLFALYEGQWRFLNKLYSQTPTEQGGFPNQVALDGDRAILRDGDAALRPLRCTNGEWKRGPEVPLRSQEPVLFTALSQGTIAALTSEGIELFTATDDTWEWRQTITGFLPSEDYSVRALELRGNVLGVALRDTAAGKGLVTLYER